MMQSLSSLPSIRATNSSYSWYSSGMKDLIREALAKHSFSVWAFMLKSPISRTKSLSQYSSLRIRLISPLSSLHCCFLAASDSSFRQEDLSAARNEACRWRLNRCRTSPLMSILQQRQPLSEELSEKIPILKLQNWLKTIGKREMTSNPESTGVEPQKLMGLLVAQQWKPLRMAIAIISSARKDSVWNISWKHTISQRSILFTIRLNLSLLQSSLLFLMGGGRRNTLQLHIFTGSWIFYSEPYIDCNTAHQPDIISNQKTNRKHTYSMSTTYYQQKWQEAIGDLLQCVEEQNTPLDENKNEKGIAYKRTDLEWFQYYGELYVRYLQAYRKLEEAYDQMVHPQKRVLMKDMLENAIVRMCEVKQNLIRYSTQTNVIQSDFINVDEILNEMKLTPKALKVPIPRFFRDGESERDRKIKQIVDDLKIPEEIEVFNDDITLEANFQTLIRIIQKLERGRQGIVRGAEIMKLRNKPHKERSTEGEITNEINIVQKYWRAFVARRELARLREEELKFLGIQKQPTNKTLLEKAEQQRKKLKLTQESREDNFEKQKLVIKGQIQRNQEKIITAKMQEERRKWINKFLQIHEFSNLPNSLAEFYEQKENPNKVEEPQKDEKKKDKGKEVKQEGKGKGSKKNEVEKFLDEHISIGPTEAVMNLQKTIESYSTTWGSRDNAEVEEEIFDLELAKKQIRPEVEAELEKNVDALINLELDCMRIKYGIKKKKQKKGKGKNKNKKKEKKVKIPQGLGKKKPEDILQQLFQNNIAKILTEANMDDFIGTHNNLNYILQKTCESQPDPSVPQVRNLVAEYIGIPLGSEFAKQKLEKWNWFLFYGPTGTGKTLLTRALQKETKALVFDISPNNVKQEYSEKSELTKLIWSVIICAKHFQPAIILCQDFETIFPAGAKGKKKADSNSFGLKMKKPLLDLKKNKLWDKNDRVSVIAYSNKPYDGSLKDMKKLFDKKIYFPYPNYPTRKLLLQTLIEKKVGKHLPNFSYNTLAHTTEGFTASSYVKCIDQVLTPNRIARFKDEPLKVSEFIVPLANTPCVFADQYEKFKKFTDQVTGLKERRNAINQKKEQGKKIPKKEAKK